MMDDSVKKNIIAQKEILSDLDKQIKNIENSDLENDQELEQLKKRSKIIQKELFDLGYSLDITRISTDDFEQKYITDTSEHSYEEITQNNLNYLSKNGLLDREFDSLFSDDELLEIERKLSSPLHREKWDKWDFVAVFTGGVLGVVADIYSDGISEGFTNSLSQSDTLKNWAKQTRGLSIDYQGPGFGGPLHEGFSSGHDILRPIKAIMQIKNGVFVGLKQTPNGFEWIKSATNQYGNSYNTHEWWESFILWIKHMGSDAANPTGLPFPGMSFLMGIPDHDVRKFALGLYKNGYTLQYIIAQALAPAIVELVVRGYIFGREFKETGEINWPSAKKLKTTEMLLASHAIVTSINIGKVVVRCNAEGPLALRKLNIPSIIMTVRYFIPFVTKRMKLNDPIEILKRNAKEIIEDYDSIIMQLSEDLNKDEDFLRFVENGKQIII